MSGSADYFVSTHARRAWWLHEYLHPTARLAENGVTRVTQGYGTSVNSTFPPLKRSSSSARTCGRSSLGGWGEPICTVIDARGPVAGSLYNSPSIVKLGIPFASNRSSIASRRRVRSAQCDSEPEAGSSGLAFRGYRGITNHRNYVRILLIRAWR